MLYLTCVFILRSIVCLLSFSGGLKRKPPNNMGGFTLNPANAVPAESA